MEEGGAEQEEAESQVETEAVKGRRWQADAGVAGFGDNASKADKSWISIWHRIS